MGNRHPALTVPQGKCSSDSQRENLEELLLFSAIPGNQGFVQKLF